MCPALNYDSSTNRLTGIGGLTIGYDAAGNQLNDQYFTYQYDAEGRVTFSNSTGQWQYPMYNALGQRVRDDQGGANPELKLTYPRDIFGQRTGTWAEYTNWTGWNVYWSQVAGQRLNMGGSSAFIDHSDAVGSTTMETDPSGAVVWDVTHYPSGKVFQEQGTRQSEVAMGLDWQVNDPAIPSATREYNFRVYRWMTPDPMGGDVTNPQSLNRYAYVQNNPTTFTDPLGLQLKYNFCHDNVGSATCVPGLGYGHWDNIYGWDEFDLMNATVAGSDTVFIDGGCIGCTSGAQLLGLFDYGVTSYLGDYSGSSGPPSQDPCVEPILNFGNNQFGTDFTARDVVGVPFPYSKYGPKGTWTVNLNISAGSEISMVSPGRFPKHALSYILGIGPTLHVPKGPGGLDSRLTKRFGENYNYTEHLENSYFSRWNPITWATHGMIDVFGIGRKRCPH